jgi:uncharacterized protein
MNITFPSMSRLFLLAAFTAITITGCGETTNTETNSDTETPETETPSQPDSSPETASPAEAVSAPDISLTDAAVAGNVEAVQQHIAAGTNLNERTPESGATALISAAGMGVTETAILLIEGGADLEVKNYEGSTALHAAAFLCHEEIVKALLANGADRDARNNAGATALYSVAGPFDDAKPIYDIIQAILGPYGLELDYERIKATRPKIAEILRAE